MHSTLSPLIAIPVIFVVVLVSQTYMSRNFDYQCGNCGERFSPSALAAALSPHRFGGQKLLRCPHCGRLGWAQAVPKAGP
jgi:DNA-directed RNA polymerase subunit RPC12/RpoP